MNKNHTIVNHAEAAQLIDTIGEETTVILVGPTGCSKTSVSKTVFEMRRKRIPNLLYANIDVANLSFGDLAMPVVDKESRCTTFYPNEHFKIHTGAPLVVNLDEFYKGTREVRNMLLPTLLEHRIGSLVLPKGSLVMATSNLTEEGLGDVAQAHAINRVTQLEMRGPNNNEWIGWGVENGIDPLLLAFADQTPQVFQSFRDDPDGTNEFIYNPRKVAGAFCTSRSLHKSNATIKNRSTLSDHMVFAALAGTVGVNTANKIMTFCNMDEQIPSYKEYAENPDKCRVPKEGTTRLMTVFAAISQVEKKDLANVMKYLNKFEESIQSIFCNRVLSMPSKSVWAAAHPSMAKAVKEMAHIFSGQ